ncbi:hypothetical protein [Paraflavitalea sp. CAU 1676]|uniref:hypothetical protein n=1 Tax=Paraflavitalea sp. CAU 1676 TaxID=3032598 RepID=UPI0023DC1EF5|nr:hypothetical protein [Paraflavitalea sp. CAU 1676]MDF2192615.1 hypothetical protein [Paraflavitalea sp. CAU 1676]
MTRRINSKQPVVVHPEQGPLPKNKVTGIFPNSEEVMPEDTKKPVGKGGSKKETKQTRPKGRKPGKK